MATAKAILKDYRQSPRKLRLVANLIKGKKVAEALANLEFLGKRASLPVKKLIKSAISNAKELNLNYQDLFVKEIKVDEGKILYRRRYRARGRTMPIRKRTSHVSLVLAEREQRNPKSLPNRQTVEKTLNPKQIKNSKSKAN